MTEDTTPANADAGKNAADDLTEADFVAHLVGQGEEAPEPETEEEQPEEAEDAETTEDISDMVSDEPEEEEADVEDDEETEDLVGFDLENLTEDQIEVIRKTLKSKAAARIGKLTGELKAAREQIASLQKQSPTQAAPEPVTSRFLDGVDSPELLAEKVKELRKLHRDTDVLLDENEHLAPDDDVKVGEHFYTKAQLKALKREIREALDEAVPYKQHEFAQAAQRAQLKATFDATMEKEVQELKDDESEVAKNFKILTESELFKQIRERVPEAVPSMDYLLAHFCKSKFGKKPKVATAKQNGRIEPPAALTGSAAPTAPARTKNTEKLAKERSARFEQSGDPEDLVAALMARNS